MSDQTSMPKLRFMLPDGSTKPCLVQIDIADFGTHIVVASHKDDHAVMGSIDNWRLVIAAISAIIAKRDAETAP